jgi:hypothetical protein
MPGMRRCHETVAGVMHDVTVDLSGIARRVLIGCVAIEVALVVLDYHMNYGGLVDVGAIRRLFNIAREDGVASWFGSTQTMLLAVTVWLVARTVGARGGRAWEVSGWLVVAAFFAWMAIDDGAKVHERIGTTARALSRGSALGGWLSAFPSYAWQVLFLPVFGALGLFTIGFLSLELDDWVGRALVIAGIGLFVVAVGMDFCEGLSRRHPYNPYEWLATFPAVVEFSTARFHRPAYDTMLHFSKSIEEFFEMLGNTLIWTAVLRHWARIANGLTVRVRG